MLTDFIGSLKAERVRRGFSLETVSRNTGISVDMLHALESAQFERLGAPVVLRNAIRAYCSAFEVDPRPYLEKYAREIAACDRQQEYIRNHGKRIRGLYRKRRPGVYSLFVFAVATAAIIYGTVWVSDKKARLADNEQIADHVWSQQDLPSDLESGLPPVALEQAKRTPARQAPDTPEPEPAHQPMLTADADLAAPARESSAPEPPPAREPDPDGEGMGLESVPRANATEVLAEDLNTSLQAYRKSYRFVIEADEKSWVQVKIDDRQTLSAMLYPGDSREWQAEKGMQIVIGNAGGVRMKWDDREVRSPGGSGRVLRFHLPDSQFVEETR